MNEKFVKFKNRWRSPLFKATLIVAGTMLLSLYANSQSITVSSTDYQQTIDMIGGDMERSSKAIQSSENPEEIVEWAFGDIEFNVCRVQYDKNQELEEGTENWDYYTKQVATMQLVQDENPDIQFFATLRSDYDGYGDNNNLPDWICDYDTKEIDTEKYGIFLADYLEYMDEQGVPIAIMSVAKEWTSYVTAAVAEEVINTIETECNSRGIDMPLIYDQGFWGLTAGENYMDDVEELGTEDLYYAFCTHNYGGGDADDWNSFITTAANLGKGTYNDETSYGGGGATSGVEPDFSTPLGAYAEKCVAYGQGLKGEVLFEIWSRGINTETRAIYCEWGGTGERLRAYYIMKLFANNILDRHYITSSTSNMTDVYTMAFREDDKIALWVINEGTESYSSKQINLESETIIGDVENYYWTENTAITGGAQTLTSSDNYFTADIDAESINCFIFEVDPNSSNLALTGTASQSSTAYSGVASRAIDGNNNGAWSGGSVTHTATETNPYWEVELDDTYSIGNINVFNRTDECCKDRLSNFTVSVVNSSENTTFSQSFTSYPDPSISVNANGAYGNTIRIQLDDTNPLSLAEVRVYESTSFVPDPDKKYYIDCIALSARLAATGESEDPYVTSTSTTGDDVEWQFTDKGNGYWHIDRAAGGSKPRLRSDNTAYADMQATSSTGSYTYYAVTESNISNRYFLTLPYGPTGYVRLGVNSSDEVKMVSTASTGSWVSFTITEVSSTKSASISNSTVEQDNIAEISIYPNPVNNTLNIENAQDAYVEIYNNVGKLIFITQSTSNNPTIDMSNLIQGIYFIKIKSNSRVVTQKIIKE